VSLPPGYMKARAWFRAASTEQLHKEFPLKPRCRHVWSYGLWTAKWICDKCGGYSNGYPKSGRFS
jgi:hypothetical protein